MLVHVSCRLLPGGGCGTWRRRRACLPWCLLAGSSTCAVFYVRSSSHQGLATGGGRSEIAKEVGAYTQATSWDGSRTVGRRRVVGIALSYLFMSTPYCDDVLSVRADNSSLIVPRISPCASLSLKAQITTGLGTLEFPDKSSYRGAFHDGEPHGTGRPVSRFDQSLPSSLAQ